MNIPFVLMDTIYARQSPNTASCASNVATHPSEVVLVEANEMVLQHFHFSTHPGVDERAPKDFQLKFGTGLCIGSHNQTGSQEREERTNTPRLHHLLRWWIPAQEDKWGQARLASQFVLVLSRFREVGGGAEPPTSGKQRPGTEHNGTELRSKTRNSGGTTKVAHNGNS